jgi:hypothetical protein
MGLGVNVNNDLLDPHQFSENISTTQPFLIHIDEEGVPVAVQVSYTDGC